MKTGKPIFVIIVKNSNVHNFIDNNVNTQTDTKIVHIGRKSQNECVVMVSAGKRIISKPYGTRVQEGVLFHMSATTKF